ncbi:MAG: hypothetical protein L0H26_07275, partial [Microlunatus sp.]|nr:hypothetical protein [Microlunatus sp.]
QTTTVVAEDPMVELSTRPALVRLPDTDRAAVQLRIDNRAGRQWATVRLDASDPEHVVRVGWSTREVQIPPGGTTDVDVGLTCPVLDPGTEVTRTITLSATDGHRRATTQLSVAQTASASPMTTLAVELDPSVVRRTNRRRGSSSVVVDNRRGRAPVRVRLTGDDPENALAFTFRPAQLDVAAGQVATSRVSFTAPRPPGGEKTTRTFTVAATDGGSSVKTTGSIILSTSDRRPWARVLFTLAGGLAILLGVMLPFVDGRGTATALGLDDDALETALNVELGNQPDLLSVGLLLVVLAGLMIFGLTGRSGRLTRWTALFSAAVLVAAAVIFSGFGLGSGVIVIGLGGVLGYIGGLLARR